MMQRVRIVPPANGSWVGTGTRVLTPDGAEISCITAIDLRIRADEAMTATLELTPDFNPMEVAPLLGPDTLRRSAEAQGFVLVPKAEAAASDLTAQTPLDTGVTRWSRGPRIVGEEGPELYSIAMPVEPPSRRSLWLWGLGIVVGFAALYAVLSLAGTALAVLTLGEIVTTLLGG